MKTPFKGSQGEKKSLAFGHCRRFGTQLRVS
jgi:hypothetical protein